MKNRMIGCMVLSLFILCISCQSKSKIGGEFHLDKLQSSDGIFEYEDIPLGISQEDLEASLDFSLDQAKSYESQYGITYNYDAMYYYKDIPLQGNLDFNENHLQTVMFTFESEEVPSSEELFDELAEMLRSYYGEESDYKETSGVIEELDNMEICSRVMKWNCTVDGQKYLLQLMDSNASVSIGYAVITTE